ncbi:cyanoglobin [Aquiflexum sp. TKW24L]|uniref:globin domain-containing protein n=1 Tax=Aquiflexum sp. TKW24L TaxID=2942212 RepID=UPI0020C13D56|nr:cyanoglobin [Aquiflexum sp. TKW24L]MCL6259104.1 cyanoglobin [Aquiflexum sp. TKW24L]
MNSPQSIYESLGQEKIKLLVNHFYKNVEKTQDLRKLYPEDLAPAEERLFLFLIHVFGGPHTYLELRGHPMLRKRHFQWPIDGAMRNSWLNCMLTAIDQITMETEVKEAIQSYFVKAANHMINQ